jgi:hemolysin activation/secretion protein
MNSTASSRLASARARVTPALLPALALASCFVTTPAFAQVAPAGAAQAAERLQREELDRQRQLQREQQAAARPASVIEAALPARSGAAPASTVKREIRELVLQGAEHMKPAFRADLARRYTGLLGIADVEALLSDITRHYVLRGYATTRAYLPEQDLTTGKLTVIVVEGRIERVDGAGLSRNVFPAGNGELLDLRALEQGIDNLNRLSANRAALDLQPGAQAGDTVVAIRNQPGRRWHVSTSLDNTGSRDTGRDQGSATFTFDNPLGLADQISVNQRAAIPYHGDRETSASTTANYAVPLGWYLFSASATTSSYAMQFAAPSGVSLPFDGSSRSATLRVERVLRREQTGQLRASGTLTWRSSKNYLLHTLIGVSSRDTTTFDAGLDYSRAALGGMLSLGASIGAGLPWLGGLSDASGLPQYAPRAEFLKGSVTASYLRSLAVGARRVNVSSTLTAQVARDVLYGSDQLTVAGLYAVRGFDRTSLAGDQGFVWRNDLALPLASSFKFGAHELPLTWKPYVGLDYGHAWSRVENSALRPLEGDLAGGTIGLSVTLGTASVDASYQRSFKRPSALPRESGRTVLRASFSY